MRHAFTIHQLAAQGGDEHITRAMQRLRKAGLENFHILPVQPRAVADLLPAVDAGDDDIFHRERFKKRFYRCVHPAAREKRRLRAVGRDELCALAQRAHRLHVLFGKAAVQRAVVAEHGVDHNDGILPPKVAEEIFRKMHLLHRAEKAHADAVEFDLKLSPVRGKGLHLVCHIAHDVAAEAVRRVRR